jgi:DNA repair protein RecO (recombination protein O)
MITLTPAIVCAVRAHGEHGAIARVMTADHGLMAGYVSGGRSRTMRPILIASNLVDCTFRARTTEQLASLSLELIQSRGPLMTEPLAAAALDWATALTAATLPEGHPYPRLYEALDGVLSAVEAAPAARRWVASLVRYELMILSELGFGLDLSAVS